MSQSASRAGERRRLVSLCWWCLLAGCLIFTSFPFRAEPASNIWPFAFIGLVPFLYALEGATAKRGFWLGWLTGFVTNMGGFWWISHVLENFGGLHSAIAWSIAALNAAYQGLQFAIFGWLFVRLSPPSGQRHSIFRVAMLFTAVEFVFPMIFPWFYANSQYRFLPMTQLAEITGVMGVTFVLVLFNATLYETIRSVRLKLPLDRPRLAIGFGATIATLIFGFIRLAQVESEMEAADKLRVGLVEANIGILNEERKANPGVSQSKLMHSHLLRHQRLSQDLEREDVDLIVWPESSYLPIGAMHIKHKPDFAVGTTEAGQLVNWRDLGESGFGWSLREKVSEMPLRAVASVREDVFAAVGDGGVVIYNDEDGRTDVITSSPSNLHAVALAPVSSRQANRQGGAVALWAAGEGGTLLQPQFRRRLGQGQATAMVDNRRLDRRTPHGGQWTQETFRAIGMFDAQSGWVAGDKGTLARINAGHAFLVPTGVTADFNGIFLGTPEDPTTRLVGSDGGIWRVRITGELVRELTPTARNLKAIHGAEGRTFVVGEKGMVLRKERSGKWQQAGKTIEEDLVSVAVDPLGRVVVAGAEGGLWSSTDDGDTWKRHDSGGMGHVTGLAPLGYVGVLPMPRKARYVRRSARPLTHEDRFLERPRLESGLVQEHDKNAVQRGLNTPILYGGITWEAAESDDGELEERKYNTAVLLDDLGRVVDTYDKNYLLMFGEYIPLGDTFPELYDMFPSGNFEAGSDVKVFDFKGYRLGVMICYEDILPKFTRRLADKDPHAIINVTNDAWFGKNSEPYLHLALATFRSIENRVPLVRSTNTGVSAIVSPTGELVHQTSLDDHETLVAELPMMEGGTIYGRIGDAFAYLMLIWLALVAMRQVQGSRTPKKGNHKA